MIDSVFKYLDKKYIIKGQDVFVPNANCTDIIANMFSLDSRVSDFLLNEWYHNKFGDTNFCMVFPDGCRKWRTRNIVHRDNDLPAMVNIDGTKIWYQNGKQHRDNDLPALVNADGGRSWFRDGIRHRDGDLPAIIQGDGSKCWVKNGQKHRDNDLPAIVWIDGKKEWYKNDNRYYPEEGITNKTFK